MASVCRSLLSFASDYGNEAAILEDAERHPEKYGHLGPTRATSIVTCIPAYTDLTGEAMPQGGGEGRLLLCLPACTLGVKSLC